MRDRKLVPTLVDEIDLGPRGSIWYLTGDSRNRPAGLHLEMEEKK